MAPRAAAADTATGLLAPEPGDSSKGPGLPGELRQLVEIADEGIKLVNDAELRLARRACDKDGKDLAAWLRRLWKAMEDLDDALDDYRGAMEKRPQQESRRKSLPEGFIRPQIVTQLWIAEGFIREQDNRNPEDIAERHYKELVIRNLLQPDIGCFDMSRCTVHDCNSPKLRSLPSGLEYCKVLKSVKIVGADSLQVIDNLPVLKDLFVQDCRKLVMISNLPALQVLVVVDCSRLQDLKGVECLRHVRIVDRVMKKLPDWLTGHDASVLQTFTIVGTAELLGKLVPDSEGWSAIRNINRVYANLPDGTPFLAYNKGKPDFQMIKTVVSPQLEDPSADVILSKLVRVVSQTGLADVVKRYFVPPLAIAVLLLLGTRDFTLIGVFLTFFAACVAGFSVIYIQKTLG
ncbi:hypothetical protein E2562_027832 [Oryza meyeriana var. granulata]|uniref:Disease resistance protein winged helix domain-containing protein n=1 Tax=Oryza meyeriana var. granulata TaxID=110450 RepID=A0A6G1DPY7_9ORYZ|nr:hypothetical protein E2562_027832 [Oryza meyeriana var. granulata]